MALLAYIIFLVFSSHCFGHILSSKKTADSAIKQQVSYEPIFTTDNQLYNFLNEDEKSRSDPPAAENSAMLKPNLFNKPIYTSDSQGYEVLNNKDGYDKTDLPIFEHSVGQEQQIPEKSIVKDDISNLASINKKEQKDKTGSWGSAVKKVLAKSRKKNFNRLKKSDDGTAEDNGNGSKEWDFIYKPFKPSKTETSDAESSSSKSWPSVISKIWSDRSNSLSRSSRSSSSSSLSSSTNNSESDKFIDSLLDKYEGKNYYGESVETVETPPTSTELLKKEVGQREGEELPDKPKVPVGKFILCSEIRSPDSDIRTLDIFDDGKSSTCILACLYYKIKYSKFYVKPEGRCTRQTMHGPGKGQPNLTDFFCVCNNGMKGMYRYLIVQEKDILYHIISKEMGTKLNLGTTEEISQYVESNFRQYLKDFLKKHRGIDWVGMYEYVRDFRWYRHDRDDRPVGKYLSDSLKEDLDDIRHFWTVTIPERMMKLGINYTPRY